MINQRTKTRHFIWALVGGAFASLTAFIASPISIGLLGEVKFSQLSIWIIYVTFAQILDLGLSQNTAKQCTNTFDHDQKRDIIDENNSIYVLFILLLIPISLIIPKPEYPIYNNITDSQWNIFKISALLNLKILYNQNALIVLNKQAYFTFFQNILAVSRFIIPIFVYYLFNNFSFVVFYFLLSTFLLIILSDIHIGIKFRTSINFILALSIAKMRIKSSFLFYASGSFAVLLSVIDRFIASYVFDPSIFSKYSLTFTLASAVNIVVLPFYRFFVGVIRPSNRVHNQRNALKLSALQSYACLISVSFICLYSNSILQLLELNFSIDIVLLCIFTLSLWGAANGWILASEIMLRSRPALQAKQIAAAIILYFAYLVVRGDPQPVDLAMVWVFHGLIQTFICPLWMSSKLSFSRYLLWIENVVLKPFLVVGSLFVTSYCVAIYSDLISIGIFVFGALLLCVAIISKGDIEQIA